MLTLATVLLGVAARRAASVEPMVALRANNQAAQIRSKELVPGRSFESGRTDG
jgi:hypothetical protein